MNSANRNYELDFWKFIFTLVILVFHSHKLLCSDGNPDLLIKGYLGVEFFFMVSGYLMMSGIIRSAEKKTEDSVWQFIIKKIKAFFPGIVFAFILNFIVWNMFCEPKDLKHSFLALLFALPELLFIRYSGVRFATHFYNGPTWYISAMLLAMFVLYPIAVKFKKKFGLYFAPVIAIAFYAWASHGTKNLNLTHEWLNYINGGLVRAVAGICVGSFLYFASEYFRNHSRRITKIGTVFLFLTETGICLSLLIFMRNPKDYDKANDVIAIVYLALLVLIVLCRTGDSSMVFGSKPMKLLYKLSLPLFLNQRVMIYYLNAVHPDFSFAKAMVIYLCGTLILSLISIPASRLIEQSGKWLMNIFSTRC